ncbi:MAG TPA: recombinase family protein [Steroidobacteraceae bacterium]|jgi:DNA invertase Pin-like site-specific DNA recombinase|nr:recombinase family protein [Steroidobacteraceae bacterium]
MGEQRVIRRVAAYTRVSTGGQDTAMQLADIRKLAALRHWEIVTTIEEKASGAKTRPARQRLIAEAKAGGCDAVVVWKLDRWGRSTVDVLTTVMELDAAGVAFVSVQDSIDMTTAQGRLMVQLLAAFAEFERAQIRERVMAGLRHAKKHGTRTGKAIGRPAKAAARGSSIKALVAQGVSLPEIARRLEMPYSSVHRIARHK